MAIKIIQITDLHVFADHGARLKGIPTRETLLDILDAVKTRHPDLDRLVITGDHTHDELRETYLDLKQLLSPWQDRMLQIPGNHDDRGLLREIFPATATCMDDCVTFSAMVGDWQFIGLDSHLPEHVSGHVEPQQLKWLQAELASGRPTGLFIHHPPVDVDSDWMDLIGIDNADQLIQIIEASPQIKFICAGHVHHEFECSIGSATLYTTPSTGIQFDPKGERPTFSDLAPGYRVIEIDGDRYTTFVERLPAAKFTPVIEEE